MNARRHRPHFLQHHLELVRGGQAEEANQTALPAAQRGLSRQGLAAMSAMPHSALERQQRPRGSGHVHLPESSLQALETAQALRGHLRPVDRRIPGEEGRLGGKLRQTPRHRLRAGASRGQGAGGRQRILGHYPSQAIVRCNWANLHLVDAIPCRSGVPFFEELVHHWRIRHGEAPERWELDCNPNASIWRRIQPILHATRLDTFDRPQPQVCCQRIVPMITSRDKNRQVSGLVPSCLPQADQTRKASEDRVEEGLTVAAELPEGDR
mmetsp:Transcript_51106/g.165424  ORF Transcript_51106/g.165424 Transcript_51106/m.165424 type:complete len:267 (+) Transcript_51106:1114-1914(+)